MTVKYSAYDPGIRETVRWLNDLGYTTSDSGDGVSKPSAGRVFDFPHVIVMLDNKNKIVDNTDLIAQALKRKGIECDGKEIEVEGVYLAGQQFSSILVRGVNDEMLGKKKERTVSNE